MCSKKVIYTYDDDEAKRKVDFIFDRGSYFFWSCCIFLAFFWGVYFPRVYLPLHGCYMVYTF